MGVCQLEDKFCLLYPCLPPQALSFSFLFLWSLEHSRLLLASALALTSAAEEPASRQDRGIAACLEVCFYKTTLQFPCLGSGPPRDPLPGSISLCSAMQQWGKSSTHWNWEFFLFWETKNVVALFPVKFRFIFRKYFHVEWKLRSWTSGGTYLP